MGWEEEDSTWLRTVLPLLPEKAAALVLLEGEGATPENWEGRREEVEEERGRRGRADMMPPAIEPKLTVIVSGILGPYLLPCADRRAGEEDVMRPWEDKGIAPSAVWDVGCCARGLIMEEVARG